jgi:hypothetical protein
MNKLVKINDQELKVKEFKGEKVVSLKDIDMLHKRPAGTASRNFNENKYNSDGTERLVEGVDFFRVKLTANEFRLQLGAGKTATEIILITESGYLMLVKSLTDDIAWKVQKQLIKEYFRAKDTDNGENMKVIALMHSEVGALIETTSQIGNRVDSLENTMTIDYCQQLALSELAKHKAIDVMGGKESSAYKDNSLKSRVFSTIWRDYKEYFQINSYKNTAVKDYGRAMEYLTAWRVQGKLQREIENCF